MIKFIDAKFEELKGQTIKSISVCGEEISINTNCSLYKMNHMQDCCEQVYVADICGDLIDLIGVPILNAECVSGDIWPEDVDKKEDKYIWVEESFTWTFYKLQTIRGSVTIRWVGTSNGYYCESVDFRRIENVETN